MNRVNTKFLHKILFSFFVINIFSLTIASEKEKGFSNHLQQKKIAKIVLTRKNKNKYLTDDAILNKVPYQVDEEFDIRKTSKLIHNLYNINAPYGFFEQIYVMQETVSADAINLHIITYEKPELEEIVILGNKRVSDSDIDDKLNLGEIQSINEIDIQRIIKSLRKVYNDKNFQLVDINYELYKKNNKASVIIAINEGIKSFVKKVIFKGTKNLRAKDLRKLIFTREDWILGMVDQAGTFNPDMFDMDKYIIEEHYKSNGYLMAKVVSIETIMDECTKQYTVIYTVNEGECYRISDVSTPGNEIVPEEILKLNIFLKPGDVYSHQNLRDSVEKLRKVWGVYGYVFADIEPVIIPDPDNRTVSITLNSDLGDKTYINRINIIGNKKTQDKVIRRRLAVCEGDLLTSSDMDVSKARVENLGYFEPRNGVDWKINRIDDDNADLDLMLKEAKTGKFNFQLGVGGSDFNVFSAAQSLKIGGALSDINFMGTGIMVRGSGSWSKQEWSAALNVANPWFLERPILAEVDIHITQASYGEELQQVSSFDQRLIGGFVGVGFTLARTWFKDSAVAGRIGGENMHNSSRPIVQTSEPGAATLQRIVTRSFVDGNLLYLNGSIAQDYRNHAMHPSSGSQWALNARIEASEGKESLLIPGYGFGRLDLDASWFTPLIDTNALVFGLHTHFGLIGTFKNKDVPYRDLYHIGGPASVRGFLYGQIGPTFLGDSIGAKKAFWINAELAFPVTQDFNMKGALFYDGGAGWDTPFTNIIPANELYLLENNSFNFRHAIGFGFRMISPQPLKIDVGFKLDKRKGENAVEVHFGANKEF